MLKSEKTLPEFQTLDEMAAFFDEHDMGEYLEGMPEVEFEIDIRSSKHYFALDPRLAARLQAVANSRGISSETLLNLWVQEKLLEGEKQAAYQVAERDKG